MVGVVILPEKTIKRLKNNIPHQYKLCFFSALIVGLIAHLYKITNWLPNWDSLVFRYDAQNMIGIGRWFLTVVCSLSSYYDLPFLNGILTIIFHAFASVCICKIFDVKKGITAALIGAMVVSFPTVTSVMMYNYVADGYSISFLFSCLAAMYLTKEKPNYIVSIILITLSVAIYQAYITVTVMLLLLYLIDELIFRKKDVLYLLKKSLKFAISGIAGMVLYYVILKLLLILSGETLLEYQGINSTTSLSNINIWQSLYAIAHLFINYFFDFSKGVSTFVILNCVIFAITVFGYLLSAIKNKSFLLVQKGLLLIIYVILLPAGANILAFINFGIDYHNLMKMGYCVFYLFFIMLYERMDTSNEKMESIKSWTILVIACFMIINQVVISNVSYHKSQMAYEKSYATLIRIADRIEQTEGADACDNILVIGALPLSKAYSDNLPPDMTGTTDGYILRADDETVGQSVLCSALNDYCGKNYKFIFADAKQALLEKEEIKNMSPWPSKDCITVIDDIIIIKLGAESE